MNNEVNMTDINYTTNYTTNVYKSSNEIDLNKVAERLQYYTDIVASTLGPSGKNIMIYKENDYLRTTKDGVTIINSFRAEPGDYESAISIELLKKVSNRSVKITGDGTTSTAILLNAFIQNLHNNLSKETMLSLDTVITHLCELLRDKYTHKIEDDSFTEDVYSIANISTDNDDKLATLIYDAYKEVGKTGEIVVTESMENESHIDTVTGYTFKCNNFNPYFHTNPLDKKSGGR